MAEKENEIKEKVKGEPMYNLPEWEMGDDGLITASALQHQRALLYTFVETALAHNDEILFNKGGLIEKETVHIDIPAELIPTDEDDTTEEIDEGIVVTRDDLNIILAGMYTPQGVKRWWYRSRKQLDGKTPMQMWDEDPDKVVRLIHGFKEAT